MKTARGIESNFSSARRFALAMRLLFLFVLLALQVACTVLDLRHAWYTRPDLPEMRSGFLGSNLQFTHPEEADVWTELNYAMPVRRNQVDAANERLAADPFVVLTTEECRELIPANSDIAACQGQPFLVRGVAFGNLFHTTENPDSQCDWLLAWWNGNSRQLWIQQCTLRFEMLMGIPEKWVAQPAPVIVFLDVEPCTVAATCHESGDLFSQKPSKRLAFIVAYD